MYTKTHVFQDIVDIISKDYAGFLDKKQINCPDNYPITDEMDETEFVKTVQSYLLDFKDDHLIFTKKTNTMPFKGFKVRRYEDALYVTEIQGEERLQIGDKILMVNGISVEAFAKENGKILKSSVHERQAWNTAFPFVHTIKVQREAGFIELKLKEFDKPAYIPEYSGHLLDDQTVVIKITDFNQGEPIQQLITDNQQMLNDAENLIIDVRVNLGGNDLFYLPLFDYIFDRPLNISELFEQDDVMYTNYTENNCNLRIASLNAFLNQPIDAETKGILENEIKKYQDFSGKGLVVHDDNVDWKINGQRSPKNVIILTDNMCASSGDTFVKNVKKSPKVTVIGRATMGVIDYCNIVQKDYGDYIFSYSVSKMNEKYYCNETGVLPDIHIPWTPKHVEADVDLNYALNLCKKVKI